MFLFFFGPKGSAVSKIHDRARAIEIIKVKSKPRCVGSDLNELDHSYTYDAQLKVSATNDRQVSDILELASDGVIELDLNSQQPCDEFRLESSYKDLDTNADNDISDVAFRQCKLEIVAEQESNRFDSSCDNGEKIDKSYELHIAVPDSYGSNSGSADGAECQSSFISNYKNDLIQQDVDLQDVSQLLVSSRDDIKQEILGIDSAAGDETIDSFIDDVIQSTDDGSICRQDGTNIIERLHGLRKKWPKMVVTEPRDATSSGVSPLSKSVQKGTKNVKEKVVHMCDVCGKSFRRFREYLNHYRIHTGERPHVCDICGKAFIRVQAAAEHRRRHTGEKPHQCDQCGLQFISGGELTKHRRYHTGEKIYKCKLCGKEMSNGRENADHKLMHEGGIFCPVCKKQFTRLYNMKEHMLIAHTGEKHFACDECGKQFSYARNLRFHKRLHRADKPLKCELCDRSFVGLTELIRHEKTQHKDHMTEIQVFL